MSAPEILFVEKSRLAFPQFVPDWIVFLAEYADQFGLSRTAEKVGYSKAAISTVLSGKYRGTWANVEAAVRGAMMGVKVDCPVLGALGLNRCLFWQKSPLSTANPKSIQLFHTCRGGCPNARNSGGQS